jgi:dolichol-phosphate mannosyltransferase
MIGSEYDLDLSVVVPVYGCESCLRELHRRVVAAVEPATPRFELIFVDDRSPDGAWSTVVELARDDPRVRGIRLTRNFGQQLAITAGLTQSQSMWSVVMDCDLQDPPELIPSLLEKAREGYDVVLGRRVVRSHSLPRLIAARTYFTFLRVFLGVEIAGDFGAFSLISARARRAFLAIPDVDRHYVPILYWIGFDRAVVDYEHGERFAGKSAYSLASLIRLAAAGILFQSTTLLRWLIYAGFLLAGLGLLVALFLVASYFWIHPLPGWTSLVVLILVTSGFVTLSTGVSGLYIGMIARQVKGRPLFLIDEEDGALASAPSEQATSLAEDAE